MTRISAGTKSPALKTIMSPGTNCLDFTNFNYPSLITLLNLGKNYLKSWISSELERANPYEIMAPETMVTISKIASNSWLESFSRGYPMNAKIIINQINKLKGSDIWLKKINTQCVYFTYFNVFYPSFRIRSSTYY